MENNTETQPPLTFLDRDKAVWTVRESEWEDKTTLQLSVVEPCGERGEVTFYMGDAEIIIELIKDAAGLE